MSTADRVPAVAYRLGPDAEANLDAIVAGLSAERGEKVTATSAIRYALMTVAKQFTTISRKPKKMSK